MIRGGKLDFLNRRLAVAETDIHTLFIVPFYKVKQIVSKVGMITGPNSNKVLDSS